MPIKLTKNQSDDLINYINDKCGNVECYANWWSGYDMSPVLDWICENLQIGDVFTQDDIDNLLMYFKELGHAAA